MKKIIILTATLLVLCLSLSSCIADMFGDAGITMPSDTKNHYSPDTSTPGTDIAEEQYGRPSYAGLNISDYIIVNYDGITLESKNLPPEITDKSIDAHIASLIDYYVSNKTIECSMTLDKEGTVSEWDYVEISFVGKIDGETFQGGSSTSNSGMIVNDYDSGYIPGFASGIIGAKIGETVNVPVTFPDNYTASLAGKEAIFEITVYGRRSFDVTDAIVDKLTNGQHKTVADFKEYYKDYLKNRYESNLLDELSSQIIQKLKDNSTVYSYPNEQILYYYNSSVSYVKLEASKLGMSIEEYMNARAITEESMRKEAEDSVLTDMMILYVLEAENQQVTDEDYKEMLEYYVDYYNSMGYNYDVKSIEQLFEYYYYPGYLKYQLSQERAINIAFEKANIVAAPEEPATPDTTPETTA